MTSPAPQGASNKVFHADKHGPFLFDYALKGFLKESARRLAQAGKRDEDADGPEEDDSDEDAKPTKKKPKKKAGGKSAYTQLQDKVSGFLFVFPRKVYFRECDLRKDDKGQVEFDSLERPLRAQTAQGPRITVVRSDSVPAGAEIDFQVRMYKGGGISLAVLEEIFAYGQYQGLGQWRSGGYGRFDLVRLERR